MARSMRWVGCATSCARRDAKVQFRPSCPTDSGVPLRDPFRGFIITIKGSFKGSTQKVKIHMKNPYGR